MGECEVLTADSPAEAYLPGTNESDQRWSNLSEGQAYYLGYLLFVDDEGYSLRPLEFVKPRTYRLQHLLLQGLLQDCVCHSSSVSGCSVRIGTCPLPDP